MTDLPVGPPSCLRLSCPCYLEISPGTSPALYSLLTHGCVLTHHTVAAKQMYQTVVTMTPLTPANGDVDPMGLGPPQTWASETWAQGDTGSA